MDCNRITTPDFTRKQISECQKCKHASGRKIWCCLFGVHIIENGKIIQPARKVKYPSKLKMAKSLVKETTKYVKAGMPNRSNAEQLRCKAICELCDEYVLKTKVGPRCQKCGCCMNLATLWKTKNCLLKKWDNN